MSYLKEPLNAIEVENLSTGHVLQKSKDHSRKAHNWNKIIYCVILATMGAYTVYEVIRYYSPSNRSTSVEYVNGINLTSFPVIVTADSDYLIEIQDVYYVNSYCDSISYSVTNLTTNDTSNVDFKSFDNWTVVYDISYQYHFVVPPKDFQFQTISTLKENECNPTVYVFFVAYSNYSGFIQDFWDSALNANLSKSFLFSVFGLTYPGLFSLYYDYYTVDDVKTIEDIYFENQAIFGRYKLDVISYLSDHNKVDNKLSSYYYNLVASEDLTDLNNTYFIIDGDSVEIGTILGVSSVSYETKFTTNYAIHWYDVISSVGGVYSALTAVFVTFGLGCLLYGSKVRSWFPKWRGIAYRDPLDNDMIDRLDVYIQQKIKEGIIKAGDKFTKTTQK